MTIQCGSCAVLSSTSEMQVLWVMGRPELSRNDRRGFIAVPFFMQKYRIILFGIVIILPFNSKIPIGHTDAPFPVSPAQYA